MRSLDRLVKFIFILSITLTCLVSVVGIGKNQVVKPSSMKLKAAPQPVNLTTFIRPNKELDLKQQMPFWVGLSFFRDPWVVAPASTTARDGLGPLFNARSCITCHVNGGRGALPAENSSAPVALIFKLGSEKGHPQLGNLGDPIYGHQLQVRSINRNINKGLAPLNPVDLSLLAAEGGVRRSCKEILGQFADGETYRLCQPHYEVVNLSYGQLAKPNVLSPRLAPPLLGLGLLEKIPQAAILKNEDVDDSDNNSISGKANWVWDRTQNKKRLGRFGFKAAQPSVEQQSAAAFNNDMGITSAIYPKEECTSVQVGCLIQKRREGLKHKLDIETSLLQQVVFFTANLAVPKVRNFNASLYKQGREVFYEFNCHDCHQPSFKIASTKKDSEEHIIWPYSDLLLHDMGEGLQDQQAEFLADGREWRTPPLWGLGLQKQVTGENAFLHDGRARSLLEAVLWHGGEAKASQQQLLMSNKSQREALLFFLNSI
ncbi:di-heme oxidoreductase family protein [Aliikangiella sp. IMCC44359]|uniref:di-heme oxidoreductase family protein n=1 Tax=Aliikangiella sp. IMCC44359 TaxID=3459125 RepID=UPI00403A99A4